jgi:hypothetical protein
MAPPTPDEVPSGPGGSGVIFNFYSGVAVATEALATKENCAKMYGAGGGSAPAPENLLKAISTATQTNPSPYGSTVFQDLGPTASATVNPIPAYTFHAGNWTVTNVYTVLTINTNQLSNFSDTHHPFDVYGIGGKTESGIQRAYRALTVLHELMHIYANGYGVGELTNLDDGVKEQQTLADSCLK